MALIQYGERLTGALKQTSYLTEGGIQWDAIPIDDRYAILYGYYRSNNVYDWINEIARKANWKGWDAKPLKNPVFRIVEFHATHMWPGTLPEAMPLAGKFKYQKELEQIWEWSNWSQQKQVAARKFTNLGDMFLKVSTRTDITGIDADGAPVIGISRVYLQMIEPSTVSEFTKDERGFFQSIRIDVPIQNEKGNDAWHTEIWDKYSVRTYVHDKAKTTPEPELAKFLVAAIPLEEIAPGMNFVPFVHAKFMDTGEERGCPPMHASLGKIDELNRQATRLAQLMFRHNKALWAAVANQNGGNNKIAAPSFADENGVVPQWEDGDILEMPGSSDIKSLSPSIDWQAAAELVASMANEIRQDCPELIYYDLQTQSNVAYETLIKWLAAAIDRASEARSNAETALIAAQKMALTIGAAGGLFEIPEGAYEKGDLNHAFEDRPILAETMADSATTMKLWKDAGLSTASALRLVGFSESEIIEIIKEGEEEAKRQGASLTASILATRTQFQAGDSPGNPRDPAGGGGSDANNI